jgi:3-hydroxyisobutyrate dehydrogenase
MLPDGVALQNVYKKILPFGKKNSVFIDCSTVDVESAKLVAELAKRQKILSLDAPVSGGVIGAESGSLTFMVGGTDNAFEIALPLFNIMGQKAVLCGESGAGQVTKICNNMILGISMIGVCEAFSLADKFNLSQQKMFDVVSTSSGHCWSLNTYCPAPGVGPLSPSDNNYKPGFSSELMLKDLSLAVTAAQNVSASTPLGAHARNIYEKFCNSSGKGKDFSAVLNYIKTCNVK